MVVEMDEAGTTRKRKIIIKERERLWPWFHMAVYETTKQGDI